MKLSLYDEQLNRIAIIEGRFISCMWSEGYNTVQQFTLELIATDEYKKKVRPDCYVGRDDRNTMMVIKTVKTKSGRLIASGKVAARLLGDCVYKGTLDGGSESSPKTLDSEIRRAYLNSKGIISNLEFQNGNNAPVYNHQVSNKSILEFMEIMCQDTDTGFRVVKSGNKLVAEFYKPGINPNIVLSERFGSLNVDSVTLSTEIYKNYAVVLGVGQDENRYRYDVDGRKGGGRIRAMIVDARDIQVPKANESSTLKSEVWLDPQEDGSVVQSDQVITEDEYGQKTTTWTEIQTGNDGLQRTFEKEIKPDYDAYKKLLKARGIEKLLEQTETMDIAVNPLAKEFGTLYNLGDIITVLMPDYGLKVQARITRFTQTAKDNQTKTVIEVGNITILK